MSTYTRCGREMEKMSMGFSSDYETACQMNASSGNPAPDPDAYDDDLEEKCPHCD